MSVLTLAQAKVHLNITSATHDAELQDTIDAAEAEIAAKCGPLTSVAKTDRVRGGGSAFVLRHTPVISITSVTPVNGTAYSAAALALLSVDPTSGVVEWTTAGGTFAAGLYDVVYQAGRASCPSDLLMGVKELVRDMWRSQRGASTRPGAGASETAANTIPGSSYELPASVLRRIRPHIQVGNG